MSREKPWFRFYASEWRSDIAVRMLSGLARCLWLEMLCIMHEATPYGYLIVAGNTVSNDDLAALAALPPNQIPSLLDELEKAGVLTRNRKGVIYSQRFLDDEARAINSSIGGKKAQKNKQQEKQQKNRTNRGVSDPKQVIEKTKENQGTQSGAQSGTRSTTPTKKEEIEIDISIPPSLRSGGCPPPLCDQVVEKPPDDQPPLALEATGPDELERAFSDYNATAERAGLPKALKFDAARKAKLRQRLKDCGGLSGWVAALARLEASAMCCGDNNRGWRADLDFLLQSQSFTRLMEGRYDNRPTAGSSHAEQRYQTSPDAPGKRDQRARKAAFFAGAARAFGG